MNISVTAEAIAPPTAVPSGFYKGNITGNKTRTSRNDNLVLNLEITLTTQGLDESVKTIGRKVYLGMTMSEAAIGIVNRDYKGITGNDLPTGDFTVDELVARITSDCMGTPVAVQIETKPNPNNPEQMFSNVTKVTPSDD